MSINTIALPLKIISETKEMKPTTLAVETQIEVRRYGFRRHLIFS